MPTKEDNLWARFRVEGGKSCYAAWDKDSRAIEEDPAKAKVTIPVTEDFFTTSGEGLYEGWSGQIVTESPALRRLRLLEKLCCQIDDIHYCLGLQSSTLITGHRAELEYKSILQQARRK